MWTEIEEYFFDYERFEEMCVNAAHLEPRLACCSVQSTTAILAAVQAV